MIIWRLVFAQMGTYTEIETKWSFIDIIEANSILDMREDIQELLMPKLLKG